MKSPQDAALRHRLSRIRGVIQSFETDLAAASPVARPDIELLISFFEDAEQNAKNEIELHELTHGGIDARKRACASPERYISNAPAPPIAIHDRGPHPPRPSREERIAWKKAELESELQKAETRSSELEKAIADWYLRALPEWDRVTADAKTRWTDNQRLVIEQYGALKLQYEQMLGSQDHAALMAHGTPESAGSQPVERSATGGSTAATDGAGKEGHESHQNPIPGSATQPAPAKTQMQEALLKRVQDAPMGTTFRYADAATIFDVSEKTIRNWLDEGKLDKGAKRSTVTAESIKRCLGIPV